MYVLGVKPWKSQHWVAPPRDELPASVEGKVEGKWDGDDASGGAGETREEVVR